MNLTLASLTTLFLMTTPTLAAVYTASHKTIDGVEVAQLHDSSAHADVAVAISVGNMAYEFKVNGKNALWFPYASVGEFAKNPNFAGVPFLGPWANRLDAAGYYANGKKYLLNNDLGNLRPGGDQLYIHGLLNYSKLWKLVSLHADAKSAYVTSRLEFWKYPDLMAQFPFAHSIDMTYRLADGQLAVETVIHNLSAEAMPLAIGYHPYFTLPDAARDEWQVHLPVDEHLALTNKLVPTGERLKMDLPEPYPLKGHQLDDGFTGLRRDANGHTEFSVMGKTEKISVVYGPKYTVAVAYAPAGKDFICFEPMTAITNGFNLNHDGKYKELQSIPAGAEWRETFWIKVTGF
jgi:aldose 1-epimerase